MHTAFERKDNADPAAVTALSVSRDHRTVYVGDEKGRVWSWSVSSKPGKGQCAIITLGNVQIHWKSFIGYTFVPKEPCLINASVLQVSPYLPSMD